MPSSLRILLLASLLTTAVAFAADLPDAGRLLKESYSPPSLIPQQAPPDHQKKVEQRKQSSGGTRFKVSDFIFTCNTNFSNKELAELMSGYRGQELTLPELYNAAATITSAYREKGYFLASAIFPAQTLAPGAPLVIEIIEGTLEKISIETTPGNTRIQKSLLEYYANQVPVNQPVKDGSLTSMIMKTNELPNISSRILLEPGSRPGTTKATLEVTEGNPYSFSLNIDNYGNEATGNNHFSGTMDLYSPFHLGDQFTLHLQTSTTGKLRNVQTGYTIPVTPFGTKTGFIYNYITYKMDGVFKSLNAYGNAHNLSFSLTHPIIRSRNLILNATIAFEGRILDDRIESIQSRSQRLNASAQAGVSGIQMDNLLGEGFTSFSLGFVSGRLSIQDLETIMTDQSSIGLHTNGGYSKFNMTLARTQTLYHKLSLYTGAYGQWSNNNLSSTEQLSLTGASAVRAWLTSESSTDKGIISTAELRYLFDSTGELPGKLEISAFIDHGYATLHSNPLPDAGNNSLNLTGAGFGIKWFDSNNYSIQSTAAWKIAGESVPSGAPVVYAKAIKKF